MTPREPTNKFMKTSCLIIHRSRNIISFVEMHRVPDLNPIPFSGTLTYQEPICSQQYHKRLPVSVSDGTSVCKMKLIQEEYRLSSTDSKLQNIVCAKPKKEVTFNMWHT